MSAALREKGAGNSQPIHAMRLSKQSPKKAPPPLKLSTFETTPSRESPCNSKTPGRASSPSPEPAAPNRLGAPPRCTPDADQSPDTNTPQASQSQQLPTGTRCSKPAA